jgi:hypothetical protein
MGTLVQDEQQHILVDKYSISNPICHLLALLGAHHILHVSRIRVNVHNFKPRAVKPCTLDITKYVSSM